MQIASMSAPHGGEGSAGSARSEVDAPRSQRTANSRVGPAEYYELSSDDGRPTGGERPEALLEPWPQGKMVSKLSMLLCCRRWNSCRMSCSSLPRSCWWLPSRLSKCRRSCFTMFLRDVGVATRSWWNSWWKCRRPYPTLRCFSGPWSSTSTFQFLLVEGETLVFKVFSQNRVQPFRFLLQNACLSGLWSRSLTFLLPVEAFTIFAQDRVHPQLRTLQLLGSTLTMSHFKGFSNFFPGRKKCD